MRCRNVTVRSRGVDPRHPRIRISLPTAFDVTVLTTSKEELITASSMCEITSPGRRPAALAAP
ncbi:MAG: hypothetical protein ABFR19_08070, partial [Pseudomonadota bacterium]